MTNNKLSHKDLRYLLFKTESYREMGSLTYNKPVFEKILNDFLMNKDVVDKFNKLVENSDWCKHYRMRTIFDDLRYVYQKNDETLELIDLNENFHSLSNFNLTEEQRLDLIEILKDNKFAQDRFNRIVKNHLESNYNYDELKRHLTKIEKKSLLNI